MTALRINQSVSVAYDPAFVSIVHVRRPSPRVHCFLIAWQLLSRNCAQVGVFSYSSNALRAFAY